MNRRDALARVALLMGGTLSAPTLMAMSDNLANASAPAAGTFVFDANQMKLVAEVTEMIIPRTKTPGAKDAKVPAFVQLMLKDCYKEDAQKAFIDGLTKLNDDSKAAYKKTFVLATPVQRTELLTKLDKEKGQFWRMAKELTLLGYFTSEPGATKALAYVAVPGRYEGSTKLKPGQKAWAM